MVDVCACAHTNTHTCTIESNRLNYIHCVFFEPLDTGQNVVLDGKGQTGIIWSKEKEKEEEINRRGGFWLISKEPFSFFVFFLQGTLCPCRLK